MENRTMLLNLMKVALLHETADREVKGFMLT
jgi:hypothetical protein